jgi:hypothetical protein
MAKYAKLFNHTGIFLLVTLALFDVIFWETKVTNHKNNFKNLNIWAIFQKF